MKFGMNLLLWTDTPPEAMLDPVANTLDLRAPFTLARARRVLSAVEQTGVDIADIGYFDNMLHEERAAGAPGRPRAPGRAAFHEDDRLPPRRGDRPDRGPVHWPHPGPPVPGRGGYQVLVSVDESTYRPRMKIAWIDRDLSMGDHPVVWSHCIGRGRAFFSALGHQGTAYSAPENQKLLEGALAWALRSEGSGCDE